MPAARWRTESTRMLQRLCGLRRERRQAGPCWGWGLHHLLLLLQMDRVLRLTCWMFIWVTTILVKNKVVSGIVSWWRTVKKYYLCKRWGCVNSSIQELRGNLELLVRSESEVQTMYIAFSCTKTLNLTRSAWCFLLNRLRCSLLMAKQQKTNYVQHVQLTVTNLKHTSLFLPGV